MVAYEDILEERMISLSHDITLICTFLIYSVVDVIEVNSDLSASEFSRSSSPLIQYAKLRKKVDPLLSGPA